MPILSLSLPSRSRDPLPLFYSSIYLCPAPPRPRRPRMRINNANKPPKGPSPPLSPSLLHCRRGGRINTLAPSSGRGKSIPKRLKLGTDMADSQFVRSLDATCLPPQVPNPLKNTLTHSHHHRSRSQHRNFPSWEGMRGEGKQFLDELMG